MSDGVPHIDGFNLLAALAGFLHGALIGQDGEVIQESVRLSISIEAGEFSD